MRLALETGEDRLLREDLATALQAVSPAIIILDQAGPNAIVVSVTRLQWNELQATERTEIITYSYNQVDTLKAALLMPNYASYLVDRTTGEAEIEYAFEVRAVSSDGVLLDRVIRDRISRSYAFCQNARIQNVYGGVQPAGFVANAHMAELCSGDTTPVRVSDLRQDVFNRLANEIATIPSIRAAIARY